MNIAMFICSSRQSNRVTNMNGVGRDDPGAPSYANRSAEENQNFEQQNMLRRITQWQDFV